MIRVMSESPKNKQSELTEENLEESRKLRKLYLEKKPKGATQASFGAEYGIGNQGAVWQCLNGKGMAISLKAAIGFAKGLKIDLADFSPRLANQAKMTALAIEPNSTQRPTNMRDLDGVEGQLITLFRLLTPEAQDQVVALAGKLRDELPASSKTDAPATAATHRVTADITQDS